MNPQRKMLFFALFALAIAWMAALGVHAVFKHSQMTAVKIHAFIAQNDLRRLSGEARAKALRDLADKINSLSAEERKKARHERLWKQWFEQMTDQEKDGFLEATLPTGFKQMMASFESLPADRRQKNIENAIKRLREDRESPPPEDDPNADPQLADTNAPPVLSEELQRKIVMTGIKTVYTGASAQTKAELAPLLEELQKNMESGRFMMRGGPR